MAIFDADIALSDVRYFRDPDGKVTGLFVSARAAAEPTEGAADEASFSGQSYLTVEMFLDNPREVEALQHGGSVHVTVATVGKESASWESPSTPSA